MFTLQPVTQFFPKVKTYYKCSSQGKHTTTCWAESSTHLSLSNVSSCIVTLAHTRSFCYVERQRTRAKIYARNSDTLDGVWRKFACFDDTSLDPHSSVRINNSDIIAAIKQQLPLFFPSHPPQLHVCTERKEFLLWFMRWTWFWPKVLLLQAPSPHSLISERLKVTRHFFNATFGFILDCSGHSNGQVSCQVCEWMCPASSFIYEVATDGPERGIQKKPFPGTQSWQTLQTVWFESVSRGRPCSVSCNAKWSWWGFTEGGEYSIAPPHTHTHTPLFFISARATIKPPNERLQNAFR